MPSVFTRIIEGELPGRFVWQDDEVVAFLSIGPLTTGHTLVVPRREIDHWLDLPPDLHHRLLEVAREIGLALEAAFAQPRVALVVAGFEVPHVHLHVFPAASMDDLDFGRADHDPDPGRLDDAADRIRAALRDNGHGDRL